MFTRRPLLILLVILATYLSVSTAVAFNPPVDKVGPLTVRIEGPARVVKTGVPQPVNVILENAGNDTIRGTVFVGVIDRWSALPAMPMDFEVGGHAKVVKAFTVTAGPGTLSALYPVHAYARFTHEGTTRTAHPILILTAEPDVAQRTLASPPWDAFPVPKDAELALWHVAAHRTVVQVFGQPARTLPPGSRGDDVTGTSAEVRSQDLAGVRRDVVAIHPPWREGKPGTAVVEFPLKLPKGGPITLRFENAVVPEGRGDGVTFRVRALPLDAPEGELGEVVFETHSDARKWGSAGEANLGMFAGKAIRLQLESHPGPKKDTGWDQSFWAEPTLVAGRPPARPAFPPKDEAGSFLLGDGRDRVRVWPGSRGLLDSVIGLQGVGAPLYVHGFEVKVAGVRVDDPRSPTVFTGADVDREGAKYQVRHHFVGADGSLDLLGSLTCEGGKLRANFRLENAPASKPWHVVDIDDVAFGPWSRKARQVYAGAGNVVRDPEAFSLAFDGHRLSTSFVGIDFEGGTSVVLAVDVPPTGFDVRPASRHYSLHAAHAQTLTLIVRANVYDAVAIYRDSNGLKPAGGVAGAAGRFVFDLWGGRYAEAKQGLERSFRYGLTGGMVVWHDWQRWGYDYRLPDITPPNPQKGTVDDLKALAAACRSSGTLFALHDNYIDFYPDADGFSYEQNIAFDADGKPVRAWLNESRGAQSYRYRADRAAPYLKRNVNWIRDQLAPTAYFIDVWSSAAPYDYWTADGRFVSRVATRDEWGSLFAWIRTTLRGAPQISESGHDQLIGWLDGAQTNHLRVGRPRPGPNGWTVWDWRCGDAERTPWFDAAHHDKFVLHGAGYPGRYEGGLDPREHGIYSDDYTATEVLTGHPAMVSNAFSRDVVRKYWLLNDLMRGLALRRVESVEYVGDDLHRQHVRWSDGGEVWVNRGETDWEVAGRVLPPYGFLARAGSVEAAVERREGLIVEASRSKEAVYVNVRGAVDGPERERPRLADFRSSGGSRFTATVEWQLEEPIKAGYRPFAHVCDASGRIVTQLVLDDAPREARGRAFTKSGTAVLPAGVKPGDTFELRVGLYRPGDGQRLAISGPDDGERRVRLGKIQVEGEGNQVTGLAWKRVDSHDDPGLARQNPGRKAVDFGAVVTAEGLRVGREGTAVVVTLLPSGSRGPRDVLLRPAALPWSLPSITKYEGRDEDGEVVARGRLRSEGGALTLPVAPEAFRYRLSGD